MEERIQCPYCFEWVEVWLDPTDLGELVMDCEVCCRPWVLEVRSDGDELQVEVRPEQD